jgi:hypothetical protein
MGVKAGSFSIVVSILAALTSLASVAVSWRALSVYRDSELFSARLSTCSDLYHHSLGYNGALKVLETRLIAGMDLQEPLFDDNWAELNDLAVRIALAETKIEFLGPDNLRSATSALAEILNERQTLLHNSSYRGQQFTAEQVESLQEGFSNANQTMLDQCTAAIESPTISLFQELT